MNETCRLCLRSETRLTSIFSKGERFERLRSRIMDCCPVTLFEDDNLPKAICHDCRSKLAITYEFREQCRRSERTLRSRYESSRPWNESNRFGILVRERSVQTERFDRSETKIGSKGREAETEAEAEAEATTTVIAMTEQEEEWKSEEKRISRAETEWQGTGNDGEKTGEGTRRKIDDDARTEKQYSCDVCSKKFVSKSGLRFHLKSHNAAKAYQCRHCGKRFVIPSYAKRHERTHSGEKRLVCHVCSAAFASSNGLKYHLRSHTGEPGYRCKICDKSFYRRKYLKEHVYTHTGEKPFVCKTCGSCYGNSGSLFVHEKKCKIETKNNEQPRQSRTYILSLKKD